MTSVKGEDPDHILALLGYVLDSVRREVATVAAETGPPRSLAARDARSLRSSQLRLLSLTPADGLRVTDLADRLGMTKQALGELADILETRGLLETVRDPTDRRVRILRPTRRGRRAVVAGSVVIDEVERRWRLRLGARRWDQLRALLVEAASTGPMS